MRRQQEMQVEAMMLYFIRWAVFCVAIMMLGEENGKAPRRMSRCSRPSLACHEYLITMRDDWERFKLRHFPRTFMFLLQCCL